jgi:hypothetical protein
MLTQLQGGKSVNPVHRVDKNLTPETSRTLN